MKHILMFGGNGFIGYEVLISVLKLPDISVTIINRGKSWEWNKKESIQCFSNVKVIKWDRSNSLSDNSELQSIIKSVVDFDAVIDFSGYKKRHVKDAVKTLKSNAKLYIYISSDSVYEVCTKEHSGPSKESDDTRPTSEDQVKRFKRRDSYGHEKLSCEECIQKHCESMKFIILRLADVIGPRDSTERWWQYQLWLKLSQHLNIPVLIPKGLRNVQLSLVYVKDIATLINNIILMNDTSLAEITNQSYNLAFTGSFTIEELLKHIGDSIYKIEHNIDSETCSVNNLSLQYSSNDDVPHIYPSVDNGPVDISKAISLLNWEPTNWKVVVQEIVKFYEEIGQNESQFIEEKEDVCDSVLKDLKSIYNPEIFAKIKTEIKFILKISST